MKTCWHCDRPSAEIVADTTSLSGKTTVEYAYHCRHCGYITPGFPTHEQLDTAYDCLCEDTFEDLQDDLDLRRHFSVAIAVILVLAAYMFVAFLVQGGGS